MVQGIDFQSHIKKLNNIGIALSSQTNLRVLLGMILKEAREFANADAGSLYIKEENKLHFEVSQNDTLDHRPGNEKESFQPYPLPITKKSIAGFITITGTFLNINDVYHIPETEEYSFNRDFDDRNDYRTRSMLVIPMKDNEGEIIGVLQLINSMDSDRNVIPFAKEYEELLLSLSSQAAVAIRNAKLIEDIKRLFGALVQYSASAIDARSPHTAGHSKRVANLSIQIAKAINQEKEGSLAEVQFSPEEIEELNFSAWLHDIGKIGVQEKILEKATKLSEDRIDVIKNRFNIIKLNIINEFTREKYAIIEEGIGDKSSIKKLSRNTELKLKKIDKDMEFILRLNKQGFLNDEDEVRLKKIYRKNYRDLEGTKKPYLTDYEFRNLSIKHGNLTAEEYQEIQSHVAYTLNIIKNIPFTHNLKNIPLYAAAHHEMLNGTGYPERLVGDEIPIQSRILAVADVYDALVASDRPYKKALTPEQAIEVIKFEAENNRLDKNIINIFIENKLYKTIPGITTFIK